MSVPVLVIHGVANRDKDLFETLVVQTLQGKVGRDWELIPVYWGDLGAQSADVADTLPYTGDRAASSPGRASTRALLLPKNGRPQATLGSKQRFDIIAAAAATTTAGSSRRASSGEALSEIIRRHLATTKYLKTTDNREILEAVGRLIARATEPLAARAAADASARRLKIDIGDVVHSVFSEVDEVLGLAFGEALGRVNNFLREEFIPNIADFLGDIFVYEHHRAALQARIWEAIEGHPRARGRGTPAKPVHVVAHSLGGVMAFQAATAGDGRRTLSIDGLVTFGSQSPYFHILDPSGSGLQPYRHDHPVVVPASSVRKWTNLWEPLDPLAFVAGRVFQLADGSPIQDRETRHKASSGLWTHSTYWASSDLITAIKDTCR